MSSALLKIGYSRVSLLCTLLMGVASFFLVVGPLALNPGNLAWLAGGYDPTQHYLGWAFYRYSSWTFPVGLNPSFGMDISSSIVYSDSIPLLAILFKPFSTTLPDPFQYLGIWLLLCFILQAYFAWLLVGLITSSNTLRFLGCIFFLFAPPMLWRIGLHAALVAHWTLLAALYLTLRKQQLRRIIWWTCLVSSVILIHFYLFVMVLGIWFANFIDTIFFSKLDSSRISFKSAALEVLSIAVVSSLLLWQAGYFAVFFSAAATQSYGISRMNLLALFDSNQWSYFWPDLQDAQGRISDLDMTARFYEGYMFLGGGAIGALILCIVFGIKKGALGFNFPSWKAHRTFIAILIIYTIFAASHQIGLGNVELSFSLPQDIYVVASIFRASARFFWPIFYLLLFYILAILIPFLEQYGNKVAISVLTILAIGQIADTSLGWLKNRRSLLMKPYQSEFGSELTDPFWRSAGAHYKNLVRIPLPEGVDTLPMQWSTWAAFAAQYHMQTNSVYLARQSSQRLQISNGMQRALLKQGTVNPKTLYILDDQEVISALSVINPQSDLLARINGFNVLAPGWLRCASCHFVPESMHLKSELLHPQLGQVIAFNKQGIGQYYLQGTNWGYPETWGVWAIGQRTSVRIPLPTAVIESSSLTIEVSKKKLRGESEYKKAKYQLFLQLIPFLGQNHPLQSFSIRDITGSIQTFNLHKTEPIEIQIPLNTAMKDVGYVQLDFVFQNPIKPKDLGLGSDERLISIGLLSAVFR